MNYYLYLLKDESKNYKIGITGNLKNRFKSINSSNPTVKIVMYKITIGTNFGQLQNKIKKDEDILHRKFAKKRTKYEWFKLGKRDIVKIFKFFGFDWQPTNGKFINYKEALKIFDNKQESEIVWK